MISQEKNRAAIEQVAIALKDLKNKAVFVGGAIVSLYADDPFTSEIRVTEDIDLTFKMKSYRHWTQMEEKLRDQKFNPDPASDSIVRYILNGIPVDIIPDGATNPVSGTNRWYAYGFEDIRNAQVGSQEIQIFSPAIFIASKFEAFLNRGLDYRTSHDIEDIIFVLQNNGEIISEISNADTDVTSFIQQQLMGMRSHRSSEEILSAHLDPIIVTESLSFLRATIEQIIHL